METSKNHLIRNFLHNGRVLVKEWYCFNLLQLTYQSYFTYKPVKLRSSLMQKINVQMVEKDELLDDNDFGPIERKNHKHSAKHYKTFDEIQSYRNIESR